MLSHWNTIRLLQDNYEPYDKTLEEFSGYVEKLEQAAKFTKLQMTTMSTTTNSTTASGKKKRKEMTKDKETNGLHKFKYGKKMVTHDDDDCWEKPGNHNAGKPH